VNPVGRCRVFGGRGAGVRLVGGRFRSGLASGVVRFLKRGRVSPSLAWQPSRVGISEAHAGAGLWVGLELQALSLSSLIGVLVPGGAAEEEFPILHLSVSGLCI
jgi:hypothetical protein